MPNYEIQRELKSAGYFALPLAIAGFELKSVGQRDEQRVIAIGHADARDFREALGRRPVGLAGTLGGTRSWPRITSPQSDPISPVGRRDRC